MNGSCRPPVMAITVIADAAKRDPNIDAGRGKVPQQRGCVGTVEAVAVIGNRAGLCRVGHQRIGADFIKLRKPASGRRAACGAQLGRERVVATGVEQDQTQAAYRLKRPDDAVECDSFIVDVVVAAQLGVDRYQIIGAADLDAMAGVIDHRNIGVLCRDEEFAHSCA